MTAVSPDTPKKTATKAKAPKKSESTAAAVAAPKTSKKTTAEPKTAKPARATKKSEASAPESEKPSVPKKPSAARKPVEQSDSPMLIFVTAEERHGMVCNAAYYIAERRGFAGGDPFQDWVEAEKEVDRLLGGSAAV